MFYPSYLNLTEEEFNRRIEELWDILRSCQLCPRNCKVNRLKGERGVCRSNENLLISSYGPHFGEERELVGTKGSGTIFFTNCNLLCVFCQNYHISHLSEGYTITEEGLAECMLYLQNIGCHNINLVTPTHFTPHIVKSIKFARDKGLTIPIVYNCGGYESTNTLKLLSGIIDIYMPDAKYTDSNLANLYSNAPDYPQINQEALLEMHRQVGRLVINSQSIAKQGLLIRHLVLPYDLAGTAALVKFIAKDLSCDTYINIMSQYRPMYKAYKHPALSRQITYTEYKKAVDLAISAGLTDIHCQMPISI